jgi:hypothetical protein
MGIGLCVCVCVCVMRKLTIRLSCPYVRRWCFRIKIIFRFCLAENKHLNNKSGKGVFKTVKWSFVVLEVLVLVSPTYGTIGVSTRFTYLRYHNSENSYVNLALLNPLMFLVVPMGAS